MIEFLEIDLGIIALLIIGSVLVIASIVLLIVNYFQETKRVDKQRRKELEDAKKNETNKVERTK